MGTPPHYPRVTLSITTKEIRPHITQGSPSPTITKGILPHYHQGNPPHITQGHSPHYNQDITKGILPTIPPLILSFTSISRGLLLYGIQTWLVVRTTKCSFMRYLHSSVNSANLSKQKHGELAIRNNNTLITT